MKILGDTNVFDSALERIRYIFAEFPIVIAGISGGKDSTVIFNLTLRVARELGRLPLRVLFIDQEAEWTYTIDTVREVMYMSEVEPMWLQMPIHLDNATSYDTQYLSCWDPEAEWIHSKDPISIKENRYGTTRFKELFAAILRTDFPRQKAAIISGVRAEECPTRNVGLTSQATYKWVTWGVKLNPPLHYGFYPLYDWSYTDVWHAIHSEKWPYNRIYDEFFRYGVPLQDMRVSNLHHETAVRSLFVLQEIEPKLYERVARRLPGVATAGHLGMKFYAKDLPFMFRDWLEYRDYLVDKLAAGNPEWQARLRRSARDWDKLFAGEDVLRERAAKEVVQSVLCNDYTGTKLSTFQLRNVMPYIYDRIDAATWRPDATFRREDDPVVYDWYRRHVKKGPARRLSHTVWIEGDILHREAISP